MNKESEDGTAGVRRCKKCNDEITSTNIDGICDSCRRKIASKIKKGAGVGSGLLGLALAVWRFATTRKS